MKSTWYEALQQICVYVTSGRSSYCCAGFGWQIRHLCQLRVVEARKLHLTEQLTGTPCVTGTACLVLVLCLSCACLRQTHGVAIYAVELVDSFCFWSSAAGLHMRARVALQASMGCCGFQDIDALQLASVLPQLSAL
jgi:hypothetical protein